MTPTPIPALPHGSGSWVCTSPAGVVREFFNRRNVEKAAAAGWRIEPVGDYLHRINEQIKAAPNA